MNTGRKPYPSDISDEEWSLIIPYLLLMKEDAEQRHHDLRELFNGLWYVIRYGIAWRAMPNDLWRRDVSRLLSTIFGLCCVWLQAGRLNRQRRSLTAGHCVRPRKAGFCVAALTMDRGEIVRMGHALQKARKRLRTLRLNTCCKAHHRLRWLHAQKRSQLALPKCITPYLGSLSWFHFYHIS